MKITWLTLVVCVSSAAAVAKARIESSGLGGWNTAPNTQYHIQTDEGPERYFKYQTESGQYRKEKRLQDGTVIGSYGWVDSNGYLRLRDYVADNTGYRVVRTKMVFVGPDSDINSAVAKAKKVPSQGGTGVQPLPGTTARPFVSVTPSPASVISSPATYQLPPVTSTPAPISSVSPYQVTSSGVSGYNYPSPVTYHPSNFPGGYKTDPNAINGYTGYGTRLGYTPQYPLYDGISATHNGFRYYLPRQYHEEENSGDVRRSGSFGYVDPFGIRRVIYYNTSPEGGFVHKKNNRYVGFDATPYDPRF